MPARPQVTPLTAGCARSTACSRHRGRLGQAAHRPVHLKLPPGRPGRGQQPGLAVERAAVHHHQRDRAPVSVQERVESSHRTTKSAARNLPRVPPTGSRATSALSRVARSRRAVSSRTPSRRAAARFDRASRLPVAGLSLPRRNAHSRRPQRAARAPSRRRDGGPLPDTRRRQAWAAAMRGRVLGAGARCRAGSRCSAGGRSPPPARRARARARSSVPSAARTNQGIRRSVRTVGAPEGSGAGPASPRTGSGPAPAPGSRRARATDGRGGGARPRSRRRAGCAGRPGTAGRPGARRRPRAPPARPWPRRTRRPVVEAREGRRPERRKHREVELRRGRSRARGAATGPPRSTAGPPAFSGPTTRPSEDRHVAHARRSRKGGRSAGREAPAIPASGSSSLRPGRRAPPGADPRRPLDRVPLESRP